jgi:hypothetical protein
VEVAVESDFVPLGLDALDQRTVAAEAPRDQEEGRVGPVPGEDVQQAPRIPRAGAVVERQREARSGPLHAAQEMSAQPILEAAMVEEAHAGIPGFRIAAR